MRRLEKYEWCMILLGPPFVAFTIWASADWVHDTLKVGWIVSYLAAPLVAAVSLAAMFGARTATTTRKRGDDDP